MKTKSRDPSWTNQNQVSSPTSPPDPNLATLVLRRLSAKGWNIDKSCITPLQRTNCAPSWEPAEKKTEDWKSFELSDFCASRIINEETLKKIFYYKCVTTTQFLAKLQQNSQGRFSPCSHHFDTLCQTLTRILRSSSITKNWGHLPFLKIWGYLSFFRNRGCLPYFSRLFKNWKELRLSCSQKWGRLTYLLY